jgi:integrase
MVHDVRINSGGITMRGDLFAWGSCRCGGAWNIIRDQFKKVSNIVCERCGLPPEKWGVDARAFKNRKGNVGRITKDRSLEFIYSIHQAKRILESIRADWDAVGPERFDPSNHSSQGRESYKLSECVKDWLSNQEDRGIKDSTVKHGELNFRLHILPILGDLDIREIVEDDIERLQRELRKKDNCGDNSVKGCLQSLSTLLRRYCHRKHVIPHVPAFPENWSAGVFVERHEVTVAEQRRLTARLVMSYPKTVRKSMLYLQKTYTTLGCRPGEAHALKRKNILEDGKVMLQGAIDPITGEYGKRKTKDIRTVPVSLPDRLLSDLRSLPVLPEGFLFTKADGKPWNQNRVSDRFSDICDIPGVTYYTYAKHAMATRTVRDAVEEGKARAEKMVGVTRKVLDGHYDLGR